MSNPLFSVIVPTHDRPQFLGQAVDSILAQTMKDFEILVVNDGGPPVLAGARDPRVKVINRALNAGPAAARNAGLELATGRYVAFLDDDDLFLPNRLELALAAFERAPVALCLIKAFSSDPNSTGPASGRLFEGNVYDEILDAGTPQVARTAVQRDLVPLFNERYLACEDIDWWLRLAEVASVASVPEVGALQRTHPGPRYLAGADSRLKFNTMLLVDHADYFAEHRRARKFRYLKIGLRELNMGDRRSARRSLLRSFREGPSFRGVRHISRTFLSAREKA